MTTRKRKEEVSRVYFCFKILVHQMFYFLAPKTCSQIKDVYNVNGEYVKTICKVDLQQSWPSSKLNCEMNSMKLANSSEYLTELRSFANAYAGGSSTWVSGKSGCTLLSLPFGSTTYSVFADQICFAEHISFCEYDSEITKKTERSI